MTIIHAVDTARPVVALTFDDGPDPTFTPQLLDILRAEGGKATFYMIGEQITANPDVARAARRDGHEIGNHTFTHPHLTRLPPAEIRQELHRTHDIIRATTGVHARTFRPPFLDYGPAVQVAAAELDYRTIGAVNLDARDWEQPGVRHIVETTRTSVRRGSVLLFHDGYGDRSQTVEAVRLLVAEWRTLGYQLVTVSELLQLTGPERFTGIPHS